MATTYKRLDDGSWGILIDPGSDAVVGATVTVTKKNGSKKRETVSEILSRADGKAVCRIVPTPQMSREEIRDSKERAATDAWKIRLRGKGLYKGRLYYIGPNSRNGYGVRLFTLPDRERGGTFLAFWVFATMVRTEKHYGVYRPEDGSTFWPTLDFVSGSAKDRSAVAGPDTPTRTRCPKCDAWYDAAEDCPDCGGY